MRGGLREFEDLKSKKYHPFSFRRGIIEVVNSQLWTADVRIVGSSQSIIKNVPMSASINPSVSAGDRCLLETFDENNPRDIIVAYTFGKKSSKYFYTVTSVSNSITSIAHGLGRAPDFISVVMNGNPYDYYLPPGARMRDVFIPQPADETYIYLQTNTVHPVTGIGVYIYTAIS